MLLSWPFFLCLLWLCEFKDFNSSELFILFYWLLSKSASKIGEVKLKYEGRLLHFLPGCYTNINPQWALSETYLYLKLPHYELSGFPTRRIAHHGSRIPRTLQRFSLGFPLQPSPTIRALSPTHIPSPITHNRPTSARKGLLERLPRKPSTTSPQKTQTNHQQEIKTTDKASNPYVHLNAGKSCEWASVVARQTQETEQCQ